VFDLHCQFAYKYWHFRYVGFSVRFWEHGTQVIDAEPANVKGMQKQPAERVATRGRDILLALGWYYPEIHRGVARFARDHLWHVTFDFDDPIPSRWRGDGILTLIGAQAGLWRRLRGKKVPIVDLAESRPEIPLPRVTMDNAAIARLAAEYFLDRGFRQFAFVHRWEMGVSRRRRDHFCAAIAQRGYPCRVLSWQQARGSSPDTREQRTRWLAGNLQNIPKPLAVFARDNEAVEVLEACFSAGLDVPDQVAVLGVDNTETVCDCLRVPLSSIDNNLEQVGYEGAALLHRLMQGKKPPSSPIYIPPIGIVERRSTNTLATEHPGVAVALRFIRENAEQQIGMVDIVKHVAMSRSGLEKAFREHYVRAPIEQLRHTRLELAKRMLRETDEKMAVVARKSGFQTPQQLCRVFRQQLGVTPKKYRASTYGRLPATDRNSNPRMSPTAS
jgi:LacI family transcriptional regulator